MYIIQLPEEVTVQWFLSEREKKFTNGIEFILLNLYLSSLACDETIKELVEGERTPYAP